MSRHFSHCTEYGKSIVFANSVGCSSHAASPHSQLRKACPRPITPRRDHDILLVHHHQGGLPRDANGRPTDASPATALCRHPTQLSRTTTCPPPVASRPDVALRGDASLGRHCPLSGPDEKGTAPGHALRTSMSWLLISAGHDIGDVSRNRTCPVFCRLISIWARLACSVSSCNTCQ